MTRIGRFGETIPPVLCGSNPEEHVSSGCRVTARELISQRHTQRTFLAACLVRAMLLLSFGRVLARNEPEHCQYFGCLSFESNVVWAHYRESQMCPGMACHITPITQVRACLRQLQVSVRSRSPDRQELVGGEGAVLLRNGAVWEGSSVKSCNRHVQLTRVRVHAGMN